MDQATAEPGPVKVKFQICDDPEVHKGLVTMTLGMLESTDPPWQRRQFSLKAG